MFEGADRPMTPRPSTARRHHLGATAVAGTLLLLTATPGAARQDGAPTPGAAAVTFAGPPYAELVALAEKAELAVIVTITEQAAVKPERAPGLAPGKARLYLEAATETLLAGRGGVGGDLRFLADRALTDQGRTPKLKKQRYLLFARAVPDRPGEIQLIAPDAMLPASPMLVERARTVLRQLAEAPSLPVVTGVREVISVAGNLAGESETQMFLATEQGEPVSLTVLQRPGMAPQWGVSWTDIVDPSARPPAPETLAWYRLACFLPRDLPDEAFLQDEAAARARAREDYAFVLEELGECPQRPR